MAYLGLYKKLAPVDSARYNSRYAPPGCLEGTRITVLNKLREWALSPSPSFGVFWLAGTAGTGKTTIAKTFCDQMALEGVLGATFFISRQNDARRDPHNIVRSIAYDLAILNTSRARSVWDDLTSTPNITSLHISEQARRLLACPSPLQQVAGLSSLVIIDALDESDKNQEGTQEGFVSLLVSSLKHQAVKILVTSRDEPWISNRLSGLTDETFKLHRMDEANVSKDVRAFYQTRFQQLIASRHLNLPGWPSSHDLDILTNRTGYLFVYAATIMKFVSAERCSPAKRLHSILSSHPERSQHPVVFQALDELYTQIIQSAAMPDGITDEYVQSRVKMLIGTIIVLQHPLPFQSIAALVMALDSECDEVELRCYLESLASVIPVPENEGDSVNIFHPSFPDYMQDPNRCKDLNLTVSSTDAHLSVAIACLRLMNEYLHEDICNIKDFAVANTDIANLQERLDRYVPESLRYACIYWILHVVSASGIAPFIEELEQFCENHILHWIEVLSLLRNLGSAFHGLPRALDWCRVSPFLLLVIYII
jgi:hypothetical protein